MQIARVAPSEGVEDGLDWTDHRRLEDAVKGQNLCTSRIRFLGAHFCGIKPTSMELI